ncbi:54S ribosomal protein L40 [Colletotrichum sp. SAR 10_65]|nr:54S ribosomal protein L40 [Colletotrichum sp. SAR 10_65]
MQKLIKRTRQAEKVFAKKMKKRQGYEITDQRQQRFREQRQQLDELNDDIRTSRLIRQEKWSMGTMAPRRDLLPEWGASEVNRNSRQTSLKFSEIENRCSWAGGVNQLCLKPKDRVVLLDGPEKGKIDRIESIDKSTGTVMLENIAKMTIAVSENFQKAIDAPPTQNAPLAVPISSIRLVHPIKDPITGSTGDVIIRQLRSYKPRKLPNGTFYFQRQIPGYNMIIPWPEADEPNREEYPVDTKSEKVSEETFVPTLLRTPMPETVIDELRNKYSKFRTRHEEDYILKKEVEEMQKKASKRLTPDAAATIRTPLQEFNTQQRLARRARGQPELTEDMLEKIGEVIAKNKARTLNAAGMSEVAPVPEAAVPETPTAESHPPPQ